MNGEQRQEQEAPQRQERHRLPFWRNPRTYIRTAYFVGPGTIGLSTLDYTLTNVAVDSFPKMLVGCTLGVAGALICYCVSPRQPRPPQEVSYQGRTREDRPIQPGREGEVVHREEWVDGELYDERIQFGPDGSFTRTEDYRAPRQAQHPAQQTPQA